MDFKRIMPPMVLLCAGAGMLVYGAVFHTLTILEEEETELSIPIPSPFDQPADPVDRHFHLPGGDRFGAIDPFHSAVPPDLPPGGEAVDPFDPGAWPPEAMEADPFAAPPGQPGELTQAEPSWFPDPHGMMFQTVTRIEWIPRTEPEWALVREVTFGGVARREDGQLKRTYRGKPPTLCPT